MAMGGTNSRCGLYINIPRGVPVALFLTNRWNLRSSYRVKTKAFSYAFCIYVCHAHLCPLGLSAIAMAL